MAKDPNKNAQTMGGPSFHPQMESLKKAGTDRYPQEKKPDSKTATQILDEDQLPPF